jgi:hypothetical protein
MMWTLTPFAGLLLVAACFTAAPARAAEKNADGKGQKRPAAVLIVRHAEKPPVGDDSVHLAAEGVKRAEALPRLFRAAKNRPGPFPAPDFIFATKDSKRSSRPAETVAPLARALNRPVNAEFANADVAGLVREILGQPKYAGKTVLICWHHGTTPRLAKELGVADAPEWKGSSFDRVWQITFDASGKATLRDRPQQLLPGDADR